MTRLVSWMTEQAYRKATIVVIAVLLVLGYGVYSMTTVKQELIPDIEFPLAVVIAQSPGDQPQQIANGVVGPIEAGTRSVGGLKSTESTSIAGLGVIVYSFDFGNSIDVIEEDLQEALDSVPLGAGVQTTVLTFDPSTLPVVTFDVRGDLSQAELYDVAQGQVATALLAEDGIASVDVVGGAVDEVHITLDRAQLLERGITYDQVSAALSDNNVILPSGQLVDEDSSLPLQTVAVLTSLDDIRAVPLTAADGSQVALGEIATVEEAPGTPIGYSRTDGQPSISVRVTKEKAANTVDVAATVHRVLEEVAPALPEGVSTPIFEDQAEFITESIRALIEEGVIGGVLAVVIVFIFLRNPRTTIITSVSIPLSIIAAVIVLDRFGYSLNIMTLSGLTIAIGRVIDDSIVVLENVYRHMAEGEPPFAAIVNGAREVTIAILGATATTCAVFLPLGLVGGLIGELFLPFAVAVVAALLASLLVAVTVIPVLARFALSGKVKAEPEKRAADTFLGRLYTPLLRWSLRHRWSTIGISLVLLVASFALVPFLPVAFLPDSGENIITVSVDARPGQSAESVLAQTVELEALLADYDVETFQTVITGTSSDLGAIGSVLEGNSPNSATMSITLESGVDKQDTADDLRERLAAMEGFDNASVSASGGGFSSSGVAITISAETAAAQDELAGFVEQVEAAVAGVDDVANVSSNLAQTQRTVEIAVDAAAAADVGLSPQSISSSLANLGTSQTITTATIDGAPRGLRLQVTGGDATTIEELGALELQPGVLLRDVATLSEVEREVRLTRVDGQQAATVSADITSTNTGGVSTEVSQAVDKLDAPDGIEVYFGGVAGDIEQGFASMFIAIITSIVLVYVIMALLFGSWLDPLVILFTLPLAAIGAIVALFVTGSALSLSAMIGVLMLVGIVVTNAIVMLEFVIMLKKERGYSTYDALVEGAQTRLRPILMTAFAAMLALVPLSLGLTEGLLIASDLGRVVIGGLFTSTLLTLLVIPAVYSLADGMRTRLANRRARRAQGQGGGGAAAAPSAPSA